MGMDTCYFLPVGWKVIFDGQLEQDRTLTDNAGNRIEIRETTAGDFSLVWRYKGRIHRHDLTIDFDMASFIVSNWILELTGKKN